ncbi:MAG: heavy metal sensor histidine kinase [Verrucomicrobia bacterium]|nr:heavy metal sensor histidine kinase [Verrucomicrobiota bacterium]
MNSSDKRRPWSLVTRLAVYYTLSAAVLLVVAMSSLYLVVVHHINSNDNLFLADTLRAVQADLADKRTINNELLADEVPPGTTDYFVRVLDLGTKEVIAEEPQIGDRLPPLGFPEPLSEHRVPTEGLEYKTPNGHWFLLMSASAVLNSDSPKPVLIQVAQDRSDDKQFTKNFGKLLVGVLIGGIVCSAVIAFWAGKRALRPLEEMATATEKVQASQLHQRLGRGRWPSELIALAAGFDQMLARLEESFDRLSRFSADLAHELRTPIQNLRGGAEVALTRTRTAEEYREVIELSIEEYQRLSSMIDSLLFLARSENAETRLNRVKFQIGPEVDKILDFYDAAAREREVDLTRFGDGELYADPMLFRRAINNLVSNALQHAPTAGRIRVLVVTELDHEVQVAVQDNGSGIGPEHLPRIFDRFYRVDAARSSSSSSTGLGLAIVKSIMELHGGSARAESELGAGTKVTLTFPGDR